MSCVILILVPSADVDHSALDMVLLCLHSYPTEPLVFTTCISILQRLIKTTSVEEFSWRAELLSNVEIFSTLCLFLRSNLTRSLIVTSSLSLLHDWISCGGIGLCLSSVDLPVLTSLSLQSEEDSFQSFLQCEDLNAASLGQFTALLQSLLQQRRTDIDYEGIEHCAEDFVQSSLFSTLLKLFSIRDSAIILVLIRFVQSSLSNVTMRHALILSNLIQILESVTNLYPRHTDIATAVQHILLSIMDEEVIAMYLVRNNVTTIFTTIFLAQSADPQVMIHTVSTLTRLCSCSRIFLLFF